MVGNWLGSPDCTIVIYKDDGKNVEGNCDVGEYRHKISGMYTNDNHIDMTITRTDPTNCSTSVGGSIQIVGPNRVNLSQYGWNGCQVKTAPVSQLLERS